ncbi:LacI family DNA-binding transcriptional regulator [Micrococcales bacterium 31B]|nr:LacI family DNA-binding transcriptional regulator [Micrococcales bacterium 31B]
MATPHDSRVATMKDVAAHAGVSLKTVSNVVNDYLHVSDSVRERVKRSIAELNYRPRAAAQELRKGSSGVITLAIPDLRFSYFAELAQLFIERADARGLTVLLRTFVQRGETEREVLSGYPLRIGDGVIFNPLDLPLADLRTRPASGLPMVFIGEHVDAGQVPDGTDAVLIDNAAATRDITALLLARGRRVAFVGAIPAQEHGSATQRLAGFLDATGGGVVIDVAGWQRADGALAAERVLREHPEVNGLVCANDQLALGALDALAARGLRVPRDMAVVGYDNLEAAEHAHPPLTTIAPDRVNLVDHALGFLVERMSGYDGPGRVHEVPYAVVERSSH